MQGIRLSFSATGCSFDFSSPITNSFNSIVQNALVNIATGQGTDKIFPAKGTTLYSQALSGVIVDINTATHVSAFASVDTLFFSSSQKVPSDTEVLVGVEIAPVSITGGHLSTEVQFTSSLGNVVGILQPIA